MASAPMQLCEEHVFNVGRAALLLAVTPNRRSIRHRQHSDDEGEGVEEQEKGSEEEQGEEEEALKGKSNWRRGVHSICSKMQKRQQPKLTDQTVTWRRTPGHSTSWTKHVLEVAPCFELQQSDAHRLVRRALQTIENETLSLRSGDTATLSPRSVDGGTLSPRSLDTFDTV